MKEMARVPQFANTHFHYKVMKCTLTAKNARSMETRKKTMILTLKNGVDEFKSSMQMTVNASRVS